MQRYNTLQEHIQLIFDYDTRQQVIQKFDVRIISSFEWNLVQSYKCILNVFSKVFDVSNASVNLVFHLIKTNHELSFSEIAI